MRKPRVTVKIKGKKVSVLDGAETEPSVSLLEKAIWAGDHMPRARPEELAQLGVLRVGSLNVNGGIQGVDGGLTNFRGACARASILAPA